LDWKQSSSCMDITTDLEAELAMRPAVLLWPGAIVPILRVLVGSASVQ